MIESEKSDLAPSDREKKAGPPSVGFGILMLVIMGPIVVSLVVAIVNGSITSTSSLLLAAGFIFVGTAVVAHFFFGHRATWILPILIILMGVMGVTVGFYAREPVWFLGGAILMVVGVAWKIPNNATHPIARWIVNIRTDLLRSSNDRKD
jgi:hypothetical protein